MANIGANVTKCNSVLIVRHILEMLVEKMETTRTQPTAGASQSVLMVYLTASPAQEIRNLTPKQISVNHLKTSVVTENT